MSYDDKVLNKQIEEIWPKIWRLCYRFVGSQLAYDMTQETFVKFLKSKHKFRGDSKLSTYLYRIAVNLCIDYKRKPSVHSYDEIDEFHPFSTGEQFHDVLAEQKINDALNELPAQRKGVFILRILEHYSTRETAEILQISEGTVKAHLHIALQDLRKKLKPLLKEMETS
jgi:RNA polymerase sigma-70 factor, ECF subfamily